MAYEPPHTETGPRARFRGQVRDESKELALRQLADGGPQALSLNAIAKSLGMSGPALYRYFANRETLLTALVVDAYRDLAEALHKAVAVPSFQPPDRLAALVDAYRAWAVDQPHRYRLLFRAPLFGYDPQAPDLVAASQPAMGAAADTVAAVLGRPADDPAVAFRATSLWAGLHGLVSLEIEGNFTSTGIDPAGLYDAQVHAVLHAVTQGAGAA
ncbi:MULTISPECIES: TetR/AcrR family transcriptional regulator [unclassified Streptomyces]|uniref:TetR/AcrR family transcriptional regulator n=1 Tax=unclassified Streptomyces TaxID=2593676 RepID=UPI002E2885FD|nr:TetR/AcrR family transcriptional regulator [Streptomyces sp. NBC_00223]